MTESTPLRKCPQCGRHYRFYAYSAADQSACPACRAKNEAEADEVEREAGARKTGDR